MRRPADLGSAALLACGAVAALLYSNFLLDWTRRGFVGMDDIVSRLEAPGEPHAMLLRSTDVVCAVLVVALLPWVRGALPRGPWRELSVWATVVFALGATIAAIVPPPCGPDVACAGPRPQIGPRQQQHRLRRRALRRRRLRLAGDPSLRPGLVPPRLRVGLLARRHGDQPALRLLQRHRRPRLGPRTDPAAHIVCISAWILCLSFLAARHRPTDRPAPRGAPTMSTLTELDDVTPAAAVRAEPRPTTATQPTGTESGRRALAGPDRERALPGRDVRRRGRGRARLARLLPRARRPAVPAHDPGRAEPRVRRRAARRGRRRTSQAARGLVDRGRVVARVPAIGRVATIVSGAARRPGVDRPGPRAAALVSWSVRARPSSRGTWPATSASPWPCSSPAAPSCCSVVPH